MRRMMIAGNWKMYKTVEEAYRFTRTLYDKLTMDKASLPEVLICPPALALDRVQHTLEKELGGADDAPFAVAAQTMESRNEGAYTGEISPLMLRELGVMRVIIGHSERRQYYNETCETVNAKAKAALAHSLTPILCVGESLDQREAGQTDAHIEAQVTAALKDIAPEDYAKLVFAYEPIWAIGTGKVCDAAEANRVCGLIRKTLGQSGGTGEATRILYGGSVKPDNSAELLGQPDIDGALIGGASLQVDDFIAIIQHAVAARNNNQAVGV